MTPTRFPDRLRTAALTGGRTTRLRGLRRRLVRPVPAPARTVVAAPDGRSGGEQFASRLRAALPEQPRARG